MVPLAVNVVAVNVLAVNVSLRGVLGFSECFGHFAVYSRVFWSLRPALTAAFSGAHGRAPGDGRGPPLPPHPTDERDGRREGCVRYNSFSNKLIIESTYT